MLSFPYLIFIGLLSSSLVGAQDIIFSDQFKEIKYADPDSRGYRQCAFWELPDGTHLHSTCDPHQIDRCGVPAKFNYKCCSGFEQKKDVFVGYRDNRMTSCVQVISPYTSCAEVILRSKEHSAFAPQLFTVSELAAEDETEPYTILAPKTNQNEGWPQASQHVIRGRYYVEDLKDGMQLETVDGHRSVYVSRYANGMTAFDCVEVTDANLECRSGLIHKIVRPLESGEVNGDADRSSVFTLLRSYQKTKAFAEDLPNEVKRELSDADSGRRFTVLAPTSEAWNAMKQKYSGKKLADIAASHVLPSQICSGNLAKKINAKQSISDQPVKIICEVDGRDSVERRYVLTECGDRRKLVEMDLTAANGVVHVLEEPIIPLSAFTWDELKNNDKCVKAMKINKFMDVVKECDLYIEPGTEYAMILPTDESFQWWSTYEPFKEEYKRFQVDKEYRCRVARYHVTPSKDRLNDMDNFASQLMGHRTNNKNDYLYETTYFQKSAYGSQLYFHYSPISDMRSHAVGDMSIYLTPRINVPPEKNISDIISERPDTSLTNKKTIAANMKEKHFEKNAPNNLYLVTTDDGWKDPRAKPGSVNPFKPEHTMYNNASLEKFLLLHHIPAYLWGDDIGYFKKDTVHKFMSSAGVELTFWRDSEGVMRIGHDEMPREKWPRVVKSNLHARDGIVWLLDGTLTCPEAICPLLVADIDYYDMYVAACQTAHLPDEPNAAKDFRDKPIVVASRHPEHCVVVLQISQKSVNLMEAD